MVNLNPFDYFNLPADFLSSFLKSQFTTLPYPTHSFTGQTIIVTGANTGLGLEAARHFVRLGASTVILGCRSVSKGEAAKLNIEASMQRLNVVEVWPVDLTSYSSVKEFCVRAGKLDRLDAVVENAGIATPTYVEAEGMESTITVNVISTFLMALLLLPVLRASGTRHNITPHLTIVASDAHEQARFKEQLSPSIFTALASPSSPKTQPDRYNTSKLLQILIVRSLASALTSSPNNPNPKNPPIILTTLTPGFCHSSLMRHARFPLNIAGWVGKRLIGRSTEMGSRTLVDAVGEERGEESHGMYLVDCGVREPSRWVRSEVGREVQGRVWGELRGVLEGIEEGVVGNI